MNISEAKRAVEHLNENFLKKYYESPSPFSTISTQDILVLLDLASLVLKVSKGMPEKKGYYGLPEGNELIDQAIDDCIFSLSKKLLGLEEFLQELVDSGKLFNKKQSVTSITEYLMK